MSGDAYTLVNELGTGTWGTVYEAVAAEGQPDAGRRVALKVLHPVWERHDTAADQLVVDVGRLQSVDHPYIVRIEGLIEVSSRTAIVMQLVDGLDLGTLVRRLRVEKDVFPVKAALELCAMVAEALDAAHGRGVLHRNLKLQNLMLTADAQIKVLDFGIARDDFDEAEAFTASVRYGSLRYREPERRDGGTSSAAGDVYSLGAVLFELLALRPLGNAETTPSAHTDKVEKALAALPVGDNRVADLLRQMLAFEPDQRPDAAVIAETARELADSQADEPLAMVAYNTIPNAQAMFEEQTDVPGDRTATGEVTQQVPALKLEETTAMVVKPEQKSAFWIGMVVGGAIVATLIFAIFGGN